jgi:glycosyltransferase involved in cell wall biosynthesis
MSHPEFAVLVATRNRPEELCNLLDSIVDSLMQPNEIVVVSSGVDITEVLNEFSQLSINHIHIEGYGQIRQKVIGLDSISEKCDWVLFLDDDLRITPTTVSELFQNLKTLERDFKVLGLGVGENKSKVITLRQKILSKFGKPKWGKVSRSGRNFDYQYSQENISTSWLNGASMWNKEALKYYKFEYLDAKYSICEDLIFSYQVSKYGKLFFIPSAKFEFQRDPKPLTDEFGAFKANAYWRLCFVLSNSELSKILFLLTQGIRTVKFAFGLTNNFREWKLKIRFGFGITVDCMKLLFGKLETNEILRSRGI